MSAAPAQDVDVQSIGFSKQQVGLGGNKSEALEEANSYAAVGYDLRERERRGLDIGAALDNLEIRRHGPQVFVCVLVCEVTET